MGIKIIQASLNEISNNINELIEIDKFYFKSKAWGKENFISDSNLKFELSRLILSNEKVIGYAIVSFKNNGIHIHRFVVKNEFRNKLIGKKLMLELLDLKKCITLKVEINNLNAINFYKTMNFEILKSENQHYLMINNNL